MKRSDFAKGIKGRLVSTTDGLLAFVPAQVPPKLEYDDTLLNAVAAATGACSALEAASLQFKNEALISGIARIFLRKEAQLSSKIEGTKTTLLQLLLFEHQGENTEPGADMQEVINYVDAQQQGFSELEKRPISLRLLRELHETLMRGVRGAARGPGQFRRVQVYLGSGGDSIKEASYVPPPPNELAPALDNLERFINDDSQLHPLLRAGVAHYQFEAIHPFMDGNGRIGRLLIMLMLHASGVIRRPLLYPSAFFERERKEYYQLLLGVSTHGAWRTWLLYFLEGIQAQATESLQRCTQMSRLYEEYAQRLKLSRQPARLFDLVDLLFQRYFVTAAQVEERLACSTQSANRYIQVLVSEGIVVQYGLGQRKRSFYAKELFDIIDA